MKQAHRDAFLQAYVLPIIEGDMREERDTEEVKRAKRK